MAAASHEEALLAAASQFGWYVGYEDNWTVLLRPGPMIDRKSTDRIAVQFTTSGRLMDAYHGTSRARMSFPRPLLGSVLGVIAK